MGKKCLKFVSISEALEELKNTLMMQPEVQKQKEIGLIIASFEEFEIRKELLKVHPSDLIERHGLWIESDDNKKFYYGIDLVEFFLDLLNSKPPEAIGKVYSKVEWVSAKVAKHQKTGESVNRCPWLRKLPKKDKYICKIHETKPEHCLNFPKSKRHALENGCKGFYTKYAFNNTGLPES